MHINKMKLPLLVGMLLVTWAVAQQSAHGIADNKLNYSYIYFENGYPTPLSGYRRPQSEANTAARANPDLVVQTGYYSLVLDCDDMEIIGYNALAGSDYRSALTQDVTVMTPAELTLSVVVNGTNFTCTSAPVQSSDEQLVRLIQSNRFNQRYDLLGLVFEDSEGNVLSETARFEVTAWADRLAFKLDFEGVAGVTETSISLLSPALTLHQAVVLADSAVLAIQPHTDTTLSAWNPADYVVAAYDRDDSSAVSYQFDPDEFALHFEVPAAGVSYPGDMDRVDEFVIEVTNPDSVAQNIPLIFEQPTPRAITGTVMLMCEESDGRPIGIPVQISKNWHGTSSDIVHRGSWLRGYTMLKLAAGESKRFRLRVIYGYWGGAGAISHSQLSLIGWGKNWKWDESALGAWGESCTYDPCLHAGVAFMDDIRPSFTMGYTSGTSHSWTENSGGGDFLIYRDSTNKYRWIKHMKTCYNWTGPNMTEVIYSGVTDDNKIRVTYTSRAVRTSDYHRRFHGYKYEFLQSVVSPRRLVFHQMAADFYDGPVYTNYYVGNATGLLSTGIINAGGNTYKDRPIPFNDRWLAIDDVTTYGTYTASRRGILALSSTLNGGTLPLYLHTYGRTWGSDKMLFDMSASSVENSYSAGDVVEGELEFIMPPKSAGDYWGTDVELINRLGSSLTNAWQAVCDEFKYNTQLGVTMNKGTLLRNYPVEIQASTTSGALLADFMINSGGIGHVPMLLKGVAAGQVLQAQRFADGVWTPLEGVDIADNNYYQGVLNSDGTMDMVFNLTRPSLDLAEAWRVRIVAESERVALPILADDFSAGSVSTTWRIYENTIDTGWRKAIAGGGSPAALASAWTITNGVAMNDSTTAANGYPYSKEAEAPLYQFFSGAGGLHDQLTLRFDYSVAAGDRLYAHLWGMTGISDLDKEFISNIEASANGNVNLETGVNQPTELTTYNLNDGAAAGFGGTATAISGPLTGSGTFETTFSIAGLNIPGVTTAADLDYYLIQFAKDEDGTAGTTSIDHFSLTASSPGEIAEPGYLDWAFLYGLSGTNALTIANPDNDAAINLAEYALGGNPTNATDIGYQPIGGSVEEGGTNWFEYVYAHRIGSEGELAYTLQSALNLRSNDWKIADYTELPMSGTLDADYEAITNRIDTAGKTNEFIRLIIEEL